MSARLHLQVESDWLNIAVAVDLDDLAIVPELLALLAPHAATRSQSADDEEIVDEPAIEVDAEPEAEAIPRPTARKPQPPVRPKATTATTATTSPLGRKLLEALHRAGGRIEDARGYATPRLCEAAKVELNGHASNVLRALDTAGLITRTQPNSRRTTRIAITPKGLEVIGRQAEPEDQPAPALTVVDEAAPSTSSSAGVASMCLSGQHALCAAVPGRCSCSCHPKGRRVA
jgi:hypothetical protein